MGSDRKSPRRPRRPSSFNSRSRVGSDIMATVTKLTETDVSIHAPAWGATVELMFDDDTSAVSIHAPAWGATYDIICIYVLLYVSIHAPAWGATRVLVLSEPKDGGFNSRSRVGSDRARGFTRQSNWKFQFTLPRGERHDRPGRVADGPAVSIHAPAWGATVSKYYIFMVYLSFNSRSRVGSDTSSNGTTSGRPRFQFTLPRGERLPST